MNINYNIIGRLNSGGGAINEDLQTWLDRLTTRGYTHPSSAQITKFNRLFNSGVLSTMDIAHMLAATGQQETGWVNLPDPENFELTKVGNVAWDSGQGQTGDGTGALLTGFNPSLATYNFLQNNNSFGVWSNTDLLEAGKTAMGAFRIETTNIGNNLIVRHTGDNYRGKNQSGTDVSVAGATSALGLTSVVRVSSTHWQFYKNGVAVGSPIAATSQALQNLAFAIMASQGNSALYNFSQQKIAFAYAGSGNINQLDLYNELAFFLT